MAETLCCCVIPRDEATLGSAAGKKKKNPLIDSPLASIFPSVIQPDKDPDVR